MQQIHSKNFILYFDIFTSLIKIILYFIFRPFIHSLYSLIHSKLVILSFAFISHLVIPVLEARYSHFTEPLFGYLVHTFWLRYDYDLWYDDYDYLMLMVSQIYDSVWCSWPCWMFPVIAVLSSHLLSSLISVSSSQSSQTAEPSICSERHFTVSQMVSEAVFEDDLL